jgi:HD-GYP domain-containing protein (c-di-GMP phosphodiesterase class II)
LRVGLYIELDLGWMSHPFPTGSFRITSRRQIDTLRDLGLKQVRYVPSRSEFPEEDRISTLPPGVSRAEAEAEAARMLAAERERRLQRAQQIEAQQKRLKACEQRFAVAQALYLRVVENVLESPDQVRDDCLQQVQATVRDMRCEGENAIRLLTESVGERAAMHPVNVSVMSLLLGKVLGLPDDELIDLGVAAFLHDMGKLKLPQRVRWYEEGQSLEDLKHYQEHVAFSVAMGNRMGLSEGAIMAIAQHHELMDGSGFPARLPAEHITPLARILGLVDRYDRLVNPPRTTQALTPHEALSMMFAQQRGQYDGPTLSAFIRMMGVYPPGSVVQLVDGRYALVVSVNTARPLKPRVIVHEPTVPKYEAIILDLEAQPQIGIRRSLRPAALPDEAFDYLGPRTRIAYGIESSGPAAKAMSEALA